MVTFDICKGNPGALSFFMLAYKDYLFKAERGFQRMLDNNITGSKLYMLWNDCCSRDTAMAVNIMCENDVDDIIKHINYENGRGIPYETDQILQ